MEELTAADIRLIRQSFRTVVAHQQELTRLFYDKLFEVDPSLRQLFQIDSQATQSKFMRMLAIFVSLMEDTTQLQDHAAKLGQRHVQYGVQPTYFDSSESALLWSLEKILGKRFTGPTRSAWYRLHQNIRIAATNPDQYHNGNAVGA